MLYAYRVGINEQSTVYRTRGSYPLRITPVKLFGHNLMIREPIKRIHYAPLSLRSLLHQIIRMNYY
jgi:hypothetical protein